MFSFVYPINASNCRSFTHRCRCRCRDSSRLIIYHQREGFGFTYKRLCSVLSLYGGVYLCRWILKPTTIYLLVCVCLFFSCFVHYLMHTHCKERSKGYTTFSCRMACHSTPTRGAELIEGVGWGGRGDKIRNTPSTLGHGLHYR